MFNITLSKQSNVRKANYIRYIDLVRLTNIRPHLFVHYDYCFCCLVLFSLHFSIISSFAGKHFHSDHWPLPSCGLLLSSTAIFYELKFPNEN